MHASSQCACFVLHVAGASATYPATVRHNKNQVTLSADLPLISSCPSRRQHTRRGRPIPWRGVIVQDVSSVHQTRSAWHCVTPRVVTPNISVMLCTECVSHMVMMMHPILEVKGEAGVSLDLPHASPPSLLSLSTPTFPCECAHHRQEILS